MTTYYAIIPKHGKTYTLIPSLLLPHAVNSLTENESIEICKNRSDAYTKACANNFVVEIESEADLPNSQQDVFYIKRKNNGLNIEVTEEKLADGVKLQRQNTRMVKPLNYKITGQLLATNETLTKENISSLEQNHNNYGVKIQQHNSFIKDKISLIIHFYLSEKEDDKKRLLSEVLQNIHAKQLPIIFKSLQDIGLDVTRLKNSQKELYQGFYSQQEENRWQKTKTALWACLFPPAALIALPLIAYWWTIGKRKEPIQKQIITNIELAAIKEAKKAASPVNTSAKSMDKLLNSKQELRKIKVTEGDSTTVYMSPQQQSKLNTWKTKAKDAKPNSTVPVQEVQNTGNTNIASR